jgi:hypothetical protein
MSERSKLGGVNVIRITGKEPGLRSRSTLRIQDAKEVDLVAVCKRTMEKLVYRKRMEFRIRPDHWDTGEIRIDWF